MKALKIGLHEYVANKSRRIRDQSVLMDLFHWENLVLHKCETNLSDYLAKNPVFAKPMEGSLIYLKKLKNIFVIAPVDKTSHNLALICKKRYEYAVSQELGNDAYNIVEDEDLNSILTRHKEWNEKYKYNHYDVLPEGRQK